jgi:hypothetical protein
MRRQSRKVWVRALDGVVSFADYLKRKTNEHLAKRRLEELEKATLLMCLRARRLLQSVQLLSTKGWDDVIGNLDRALIESIVELDYLHVTTVRTVRGRRVEITPECKASLFATQVVIFEHMQQGSVRAGHERWHEEAVALRAMCGMKPGHFWHGRRMTGDGGILKELLKHAGDDVTRKGRAMELIEWYPLSSWTEHNSPNMNFYVKRRRNGRLRTLERRTHVALIDIAARAGADICWTWASHLGIPEPTRVQRLRAVGFAAKTRPRRRAASS